MNFVPYADHWVGMHDNNKRLCCVNDTGRFIWQAHDEGLTDTEILRQLSRDPLSIDATMEAEVRHILHTIRELDQEASVAWPQKPVSSGLTLPVPSGYRADKHLSSGTFCVGDAIVAVQATQALFRDIVLPLLGHLMSQHQDEPHLRVRIVHQKQEYHLQINDQQISPGSRDALLERMMFEILEVAYRVKPKLAVLHAAAIARNNAALLFIGSQGSGKSTLVASLCARGASYLADDLCPLDTSGGLVPVPAPQAIKEGSWPILGQVHPQLLTSPTYQRFGLSVRYLAPAAPDPDNWLRTWPVKALVFPMYRPHGPALIERLDAMQKLSYLGKSNSLRGSAELNELLAWLQGKPAFRLQYSHIDDAEALLRNCRLI